MIGRAALVSISLLAIAAPSRAQTPTPTPPPQEPLQPDRPDVTNGTHIVDTGLLQMEFGGLYTRISADERNGGSPFTARVGLAEWLEARIGADGLLSQVAGGSRATGFGNVQIGAKLRLWADPGGIPVLSILPTVNLPTASADKGLGSGDADYTVVFLTGTDFLTRGHIDINYGIGQIGAGNGRPHFVQHLVSASASVAATEAWNPYAEVFWFSRQGPDAGAMAAMDVGAIFTVNPRLALDGGMQFGLSQAAPGVAAFAGISVVVGDVLGGHGVHARERTAEKRARVPHR
jgi:Putative MetA-pathway of phenol degradation